MLSSTRRGVFLLRDLYIERDTDSDRVIMESLIAFGKTIIAFGIPVPARHFTRQGRNDSVSN